MRFLLAPAILTVLLSLQATPQTAAGAGAVNGVIRDPDGEGLPGADVILTCEPLGLRREMETTIDGVFDAAGLIPARGYRLQVARKGFAGWESGDLEVPAGKALIFDITLPQTGGAEAEKGQPVVYMRHGPETGLAVVATRLEIEDLPTRDRRLDALVLLAPGLARGVGVRRPSVLSWTSTLPILVDGIATENRFTLESAEVATRVSQDSAESLQMLTGGFPAQLGGTLGGLVNVATRSGTNAYHGTVYEYYRNPDWTSVGRYALGRNLAGRQHQAGASFGGPLVKNRLHLFANYEGRDSQSSVLSRVTNPVLADASGMSIPTASCRATATQCTAAARFIESQMNVTASRPLRSGAGIVKLDYLGDGGSAFRFEVRDGYWHWPQGLLAESVAPNGGVLGQADFRVRTQYFKAGWTAALGANGTNELALGLFRDRLSRSPLNSGLSTGALSISVAGVSVGSADPNRASVRDLHRNQIGDHIRATTGGHTIQLGATWSENVSLFDELALASGAYQYGSLTDFARDMAGDGKNYALFRQTLGVADRKSRPRDFSAYAQDTWRFRRRLTVDGGLRWDKTVMPQPVAVDSSNYRTGIIPSPNLAFSARVGAAYLLDDRTVARFGFGMFYAPFSGEFLDTLLLGSAKKQLNILVNRTYTAAPTFPNAVASLTTAPAGTKNLAYAASKFWYPYTPQTSVSIERQLASDSLVSIRYVGSPGNRLLTVKDINLNEATTAKTYTILGSSGQAAGTYEAKVYTARGSNNYSHVYEVGNAGSSSYHAVVLLYSKSMSHGIGAQASYTWSRAISNINGPWAVPSVPVNTLNGDPKADRGTANTDQRHRATVSWTWRPMLGKSAPQFAKYLLNNWQQAAIVTLGSALPATAKVLVSGQQFTGTNMLYTTTLNGSDGWGRVPFLPLNSLRMEAESNVDVRLARAIPFTESISANLAIEVFNLFNRQFTTGVNTTAFVASGGTLTPVNGLGAGNTASLPRSIQLAFRLVF